MDDGLQNHEWCSLNRGCVIGWNSKFCLQNAPLSLNLLPCEHFTPLILILWVMVCIPSALKDHKCEPWLVYWESANVKIGNIFRWDFAIYFVQIWQYISLRFVENAHFQSAEAVWQRRLKPSDWISHCEYTAHFAASEPYDRCSQFLTS